jgi:hypothetical protein
LTAFPIHFCKNKIDFNFLSNDHCERRFSTCQWQTLSKQASCIVLATNKNMNLPHVVTLQSLNNLSQVISSPPFPLFPPPSSSTSSSASSSTTHPVVGTWIILSTVILLNSHHTEEHSEGGGRGETEWIITVGQNHHHHHHGNGLLGGGGGQGQGEDEWWEVRMNHSKVLKLIQVCLYVTVAVGFLSFSPDVVGKNTVG